MIRFALIFTLILSHWCCVSGDEKLGPDEPIAAINGDPVLLGELNLVLFDKLGIRDLDRATPQVQQAATTILVRQHLAMRTLKQQGGRSLQQMIDRQIANFSSEAERRGSSLQQHARQRKSSEASLRASLGWQVAWQQYLKSRLTDKNLRTYYDRNRHRYAGGRWEVSQIFLQLDPNDEASVEIAQRRMAELAAQLRKAAAPDIAFANAARDHSDAGSAAAGGKVGWVEVDGDLPSSVMTVVRGTQPGEVSTPVRSPLGLHLVFVHDFQSKDLKFEDLTDLSQLRRDATDAMFANLIRQQKDIKVSWFISALKPPAGVSLIPQ